MFDQLFIQSNEPAVQPWAILSKLGNSITEKASEHWNHPEVADTATHTHKRPDNPGI